MLSLVLADRGRSLDRGPCPLGYSHVLDGYRSCALDTPPCAQKVIDRPVEGVFMEECGQQCGDDCVAVSLFVTKECWLYSSLGGVEMYDEQSVLCARDPAPVPAVAPAVVTPAIVTPAIVSPAIVAPTFVTPTAASPAIATPTIATAAVVNPVEAAAAAPVVTAPSMVAALPTGVWADVPLSRNDTVLDHIKNVGSDIWLAGGAMVHGVPPGAVVALAAGACTGTAASTLHTHCMRTACRLHVDRM